MQGPYGNEDDSFVSKYMGRAYVFKFAEHVPTGNVALDLRK